MKDIYVQDLFKMDQGTVKGWVYRIRHLKDDVFIVLRDSSGIIQCVVHKNNVTPEIWDLANELTIESSIEVSGKIVSQEKAPNGKEMIVESLKVYQIAEPFPIAKDFSEEFLLSVRHLWIRSRKMTNILKVRSTLTGAIHEFFRKKGFYEFHPPIFQPTQCEGGATLFEVKYFDNNKVYLTQSWQLYAELAIFALEKIYDVAPTFRAERSKTSRHLAEFWMAEMEVAWASYLDVIKIAFEEIKYIIDKIVKENERELKELNVNIDYLKWLRDQEYKIITYDDALALLKEKFNLEIPWGKDLRTIEEKHIADYFKVPVAVTHYPKEIMAFYKPVDYEKKSIGPVAKCFDILAPNVGEIFGGSERDLDIEAMKEALTKDGENPSNYEWYFDSRRYGSVQHAGYGMGVERVLMWLLNLDNIKDTIPFPRTMQRWTP
ncbi:MAG: asparagine--tRNA ligase [Candidatus Woesearchaeota archaeon]